MLAFTENHIQLTSFLRYRSKTLLADMNKRNDYIPCVHGSHYRKLFPSWSSMSSTFVKRIRQLFLSINRKQLRDPSELFKRRNKEVR